MKRFILVCNLYVAKSCSKLFLQESAQVKLPPTLENLSEMSDSEWVLTALRNTSKAAPAYTLLSP